MRGFGEIAELSSVHIGPSTWDKWCKFAKSPSGVWSRNKNFNPAWKIVKC